MFGLFRKKQKLTEDEYSFFKNIVFKLPIKYVFLAIQVNEEFILGKKPNRLGYEGSFTLLLNAKLESRFINKSLPNFFIIKDIKIWNSVKKTYEFIELYVLQGMFSGYTIKSKITDLDFNIVDTTQIKEKTFENQDKIALNKIFGKISDNLHSTLDIDSTFRIEISNESYYVIKDLGDGNYMTVNQSGAVFFMMHDPYKIEKLFEDKDSFINAIESGEFNIQKFYESQFS